MAGATSLIQTQWNVSHNPSSSTASTSYMDDYSPEHDISNIDIFRKGEVQDYMDIGDMEIVCSSCGAMIWSYNNMFSFTSLGGKVESRLNDGVGPPQFVISGQNYHRIGSLLPVDGQSPKFAQLYIYDTQNEINNRLSHFRFPDSDNQLDPMLVNEILVVMDGHNKLVQSFRMLKLEEMMDDFRKGNFFGRVIASMYTIEFQKRGFSICRMFANLLLSASMSDPKNVWDQLFEILSDGILYQRRRVLDNPDLVMSNEDLQQFCLLEIDTYLRENGKCLDDFECMPKLLISNNGNFNNILLDNELRNTRLQFSDDSVQNEKLREFAKWILDIGDGKIGNGEDAESIVEIPPDIVIHSLDNPIGDIVQATYPNLLENITTRKKVFSNSYGTV
ncbi:DNA helicase [Trifolium repens]|nr:DNA helicase [Trifolium repens]